MALRAAWAFIVAGAASVAPAGAAEVMKLGHIMSPKHQVHLTAKKFADEVKARTNGAVEIQLFPSGQLGQEKEMFESIRLGSLELGLIAGNAIESFEASEGIFSLPYAFSSYEHVYRVQDGPVGKEIAKRVLDKTGVRYLGFGNIGFRHTLTRNKPVASPADFAGLKIRVPPSPAFVNAFRLLGANPTPIPGGEMYTALKTGVVDGVEGAPDILLDFKMFEVAKNYSLTGHIYTDIPLVIADRLWKSMAPARQSSFADAARAAELYQRDLIRQGESAMFDALRKSGVNVLKVDTAPMREKMTSYYDEFATRIGGRELISQALGAGK
jgi:tripartite ATP-independent transporter DctP family solute receptor